MDDLTQLTRFGDRLTFLYLEKGHIEQHLRSVAYVTEQESIPIPAASLALLMLGPGTTITHAAIKNLADCNCLVAWCGEDGTRLLERILPDVEEVLHGRADLGEGPSESPGGPQSLDDRAEGRDLPRPHDRPPPG
jgi:hypothetical protein